MLYYFVLEVVLILIITTYAWRYKKCCFKPTSTPQCVSDEETASDVHCSTMAVPTSKALEMAAKESAEPSAREHPFSLDGTTQVPYSANWSSPWRAFSPRTWDTNADHWQEPADEPVLAPYIERFAYYISMRHELLRVVFIKKDDTLSRPDRILVLWITTYLALHMTAQWSAATQERNNDDGYNEKSEGEKEMIALQASIMTAAVVGLVDVILCLISRLRCATFKIGRLLSIPFAFLCLLGFHFTLYGILNGELADEKTIGWWFVSLLWGWAFATPVNIAVRVWLYGRGYTMLGLGPKRRLLGDLCASSVTNTIV